MVSRTIDFAIDRDPDSDIRQSYPIRSRIYGWFFRMEELPTGYWQVKGRDRHGHTLTQVGDDPEQLLAAAEAAASDLSNDTIWS